MKLNNISRKIWHNKWKSIAISILAILILSWVGVLIYISQFNKRELSNFHAFVESWEAKGESVDADDFFTPIDSNPSEASKLTDFHQHPAFLDEVANTQTPKLPHVDDLDIKGLNNDFHFLSHEPNNAGRKPDYLTDIDQWLDAHTSNLSEKQTAIQILLLLKPLEARLNGISEASKRPSATYTNPLTNSEEAMNTHGLEIKLNTLFTTRAVLRALAEKPQKALDDLSTAIRICKHSESAASLLGAVPTTISYATITSSVRIILATHTLTPEMLQNLDTQLSTLNPQAFLLTAIRGEIACFCTEISKLIHPSNESASLSEDYSFQAKLKYIIPTQWGDALEEYKISKAPAAYLIHLQLGDIQSIADNVLYSKNTRSTTLSPTQIQWIHRQAQSKEADGFHGTLTAILPPHADFQNMRAAIAIERYRLKYDHIPPSLNDLVPEFRKKIPSDLYTGTPLHYKPQPDGKFQLYSTAPDQIDNSGDEDSDDIIWQPAQSLKE